MELREIGKSGLKVAPLAFGGNVFGWTTDEQTSFDLLDGFVDAGLNLVDTADMYSVWVPGHVGGESETVIGKWLAARGNRDKVVIATKVGMELAPDKKGLSKDYIMRAAEDSLRRLQTDYIDLYQSHRDDKETPLDETLEAYSQLIADGKVRAIGASNYDADRLAEAVATSERLAIPSYQCLQPEYNLYARAGFEEKLEPLCLEKGIGVIGYFSLASGFLTGKYRSSDDFSKSARGGGMAKYLNERGTKILAALDAVAAEVDSTPASVALAWLIARPSVTAPIASATNLDQLKDLIAATALELSPDAVARLDDASAW